MGVDIDTFRSSSLVCLVTPWMDLGTLRAFTSSALFLPETDTYRIVSEGTARLTIAHTGTQLDEVAQGLAYLHDEDVVHGDINDVRVYVRWIGLVACN
jgi:serine/threonine protein kinase